MNFKKVGLTVLIILLVGGGSISAQNLDYTTTPEEVQFGYSGFGSYQAIGSMGNEYFAGYDANTTPPNPTVSVGPQSALAQGQIHKVLMDDDTKRTISLGSTLTLQEGYALKYLDISINTAPTPTSTATPTSTCWVVDKNTTACTYSMGNQFTGSTILVSLLHDGNVVDPGTPLSAGQTYVYAPMKVGVVSFLPIIFVHINDVNNASEIVTIDGIFQISEDFINVPTTTPTSTATPTSIPTPIPTTPIQTPTPTPTATYTPTSMPTLTPTATVIPTPTPSNELQLEQEVKELKERLNKTEERQNQQENRISWLESTVNSIIDWFKRLF